jgi:hypothetical protein
MVEKINRLGIEGCERQLETMIKELRTGKDEFLKCGLILDFEEKWMELYVR